MGRPKSATFRTADIVGIDLLSLVARNLAERLPDPEAGETFRLPALVDVLIERGWVGEKAGQGFYKKEGADILTLDSKAMAYREKQPARLPLLEAPAASKTSACVSDPLPKPDAVSAFCAGRSVRRCCLARVAPDILLR